MVDMEGGECSIDHMFSGEKNREYSSRQKMLELNLFTKLEFLEKLQGVVETPSFPAPILFIDMSTGFFFITNMYTIYYSKASPIQYNLLIKNTVLRNCAGNAEKEIKVLIPNRVKSKKNNKQVS